MATKKLLKAPAQTLDYDAMMARLDAMQEPAAAPEPASAGVGPTLRDMAVKGAQGVIGLGQSVVGMGNLVSRGAAGKAMDSIGYDPERTKSMMGEYLSQAQKDSDAKVQAADGFVDTVGQAVTEPRFLAGAIMESMPGLLSIGGMQGAAARLIAGKAAMATGEGALAASGLSGPAAIRAALATRAGQDAAKAALASNASRLMAIGGTAEGAQTAGTIAQQAQHAGREYSDYALPALGAGAATGAIAFGAGKLMGGDAATRLFTGTGGMKGGVPAQIAKSAFSEGALEEMNQSGSEQAFTNIAMGEPDLMRGVPGAAGVGLVTGTAMGGAMGALGHGGSAQTAQATQPPAPGQPPVTPPPAPPPGPMQRAAATITPTNFGASPIGTVMGASPVANAWTGFDASNLPTGMGAPAQIMDQAELDDLVQTERRDQQVMLAQMEQDRQKQAQIEAAFAAKPDMDAATTAVEPAPTTPADQAQSGDIMNRLGKPFTNLFAATEKAKATGPDFEPVQVGKYAYVVRKKTVKQDATPVKGAEAATESVAESITPISNGSNQQLSSLETVSSEKPAKPDSTPAASTQSAPPGVTSAATPTSQPPGATIEKAPEAKQAETKRPEAPTPDISKPPAVPAVPVAPEGLAVRLNGKDVVVSAKPKQTSHNGHRAWEFGDVLVTAVKNPHASGVSHFSFHLIGRDGQFNQSLDKPFEGGIDGTYATGPGMPPSFEKIVEYVQAKAAQQPTAPEPTAAAPKAPVKNAVRQKIEQARQARADYFTPGNIVKAYDGHERVISYTPPDEKGEGWSVTAQKVIEQDGRWVVDPQSPSPRTHSTYPDAAAIKAGPVAKAEAAAPEAQGEQVSQYTGKFGKGMGHEAAKLEAETRNAANAGNGITYSAEEHGNPTLENDWAVVGRKVAVPSPKNLRDAIAKKQAEKGAHSPEADHQAAKAEVERRRAEQQAKTEVTHNGTRIYPTRIAGRDGAAPTDKWAVESQDNKTRKANGERAIGGDTLHDTLDSAKAAADEQASRHIKDQADKAERDASEKAASDAAQAKKDANKKLTLRERAANSTLDKPTNLPPNAGLGNGTRREAMQKAVEQSRLVTSKMVRDQAAWKADNDTIERGRANNLMANFSNPNLPGMQKINDAAARLKANKYEKPEYRVYMGRDDNGPFYEITKTEHDYAQALKDKPKDPRENYIKAAADSIGSLRKSDVERVLSNLANDNIDGVTRANLADYIKENHPDYTQEVDDVLAELSGANLEPHQMTEAQFGEQERQRTLVQLRGDLQKAKSGETKVNVFANGAKSRAGLIRDIEEQIAKVEKAPAENFASDHLGHINRAMSAGKTVPKENLTRYDVTPIIAPAIHQDPGKAPETATAPVVAQSMAKAAKALPGSWAEGVKLATMKADLLRMIDEAIKETPDYEAYQKFVAKDGQEVADSMFIGKRFNFGLEAPASKPTITFDVPGDGKFKVRNSTRGLMEFRAKIAKAGSGFNVTRRPGLPASTGVAKGSTSQIEALSSMLEELDFEAAVDYARETGISLNDAKVPPHIRDKFKAYLKDGTLPNQPFSPTRYWEYQSASRADKDGNQIREASLTKEIGADTYMANVSGTNATGFKFTVAKNGDAFEKQSGSYGTFSDALQGAESKINSIEPAVVKPKDTGWNMAGVGFAGKRYNGRNITLPDGREVVARIYENAGQYEDAEVKVDGVRVFAKTDRYKAEKLADDFIRTLTTPLDKASPSKTKGKITLAEASNLAISMAPNKPANRVTMVNQRTKIVEYLVKNGISKATAEGIVESALAAQAQANRGGTLMFLQNSYLKDVLIRRDVVQMPVNEVQEQFEKAQKEKEAAQQPPAEEAKAATPAAEVKPTEEISPINAINIAHALKKDGIQIGKVSRDFYQEDGYVVVIRMDAELKPDELRSQITKAMRYAESVAQQVDANAIVLKRNGMQIWAVQAKRGPAPKPSFKMGVLQWGYVNEDAAKADAKPAQQEAAKAGGKATISDVGEKIGGARKDTASSTGPKLARQAEADDRPTWAKRFRIGQIAAGFDVNVNGRDITGKWTISDTRTTDRLGQPHQLGSYFDTKEDAEAALPLLAVAQKHRVTFGGKDADGNQQYEIWRDISDRKRVKVVDREFASRTDALEYMAKHAKDILETSTTFGEADIPKPESTTRVGAERRTGDVVGKDFQDTFGFRAIEFGNWNNQEERQEVMNAAYDGLHDLAEVLGIPPKAIGLNGDLALAFGARGQGLSSARAHYEPSRAVMNLTKMNGAGALAHEWFHALDHYLARQDGKTPAEWTVNLDGTRSLKVNDDYMASGGFKWKDSGVRQELRDAYTTLVKALFTKAEQYVEDTAKADKFVGKTKTDLEEQLTKLRTELAEQKDVRYYKRNNKPASAEQLAEFDAIAAKLLNGEGLQYAWRATNPDAPARISGSGRHTNDALEALSAIYKAVRGRNGFDSTNKNGIFDTLRGYMGRYHERLKMLADAQSATAKTKQVPTSFAMDAKSLDQGRGGDYWTTPHEMVARAFQGYVEDMIAAKNGRSPFLNYAPENSGILTPWGVKRPFPAGQERKAMNQAFDAFVREIKTKQTNQGTAMYSQGLIAPKSSGPKPTLDQIQGLIDKVQQVAKDIIPVSIIAGPHEISGLEVPVGAKPTGAVIDGHIYLFADNIRTFGVAYVTLFHEIFHLGLQRVIPAEDYATLLKQFANDPLVAEYVQTWKDSEEGQRKAKTLPSQSYEALANEEALAMVSETLSDNFGIGSRKLPSLAKVVLNWLANVADHVGLPTQFSNWIRDLTRTEAERFVSDMVRAVLSGQKNLAKMQAKYGTVVEKLGGAGDRFSFGRAPIWRSALADGVDALNAKALPSIGWLAQIQGMVNKGAVKADEVEWSGITDWLRLQPGKVTKEQVSEFLKGNGVQVQETVLKQSWQWQVFDLYGNTETFKTEKEAEAAAVEWRINQWQEMNLSEPTISEEYGWWVVEDNLGQRKEFSDEDDAKEYASSYLEEKERENDESISVSEKNENDIEGNTKYSTYQLPGGTNYREVLLTLPEKTVADNFTIPEYAAWVEDDGDFKLVQNDAQGNYKHDLTNWRKSKEKAIAEIAKANGLSDTRKANYKSSHWDQPNVLAHIRLNDRVDADGKRVLFVEEIQSDWGQAGKKQGFNLEPEKKARYEKLRARWLEGSAMSESELAEWDSLDGQSKAGTIPNAPFVGKTDAWVSLAIKRIIKMAVDEGYDKVAFVNGEQSAERYDLSKQISRIEYTDTGTLVATDINGREALREQVPENKIEDYIGKEAARKLLESKPVRDPGRGDVNAKTRRIEGDGLKVGGEGMKAFYDKIVPSVAKDVLRKLGGGKMETVDIRQTDDRELVDDDGVDYVDKGTVSTQPAFTITDAMRAKAAGGVPMFAEGNVKNPTTIPALQQAIRELTGTFRGNALGRIVATTSDKIKSEWEPLIRESGIKRSMTNNDVVGNQGGRSADDTTPGGTLLDVEKSLESKGLEARLYENHGFIVVSKIIVPKDSRGQGIGTAAMRELFEYADRTGQQIALTPSSDFGGNKAKLNKFYRGLGFRIYKGFTVRETLVRDPNESTAPNSGGAYSLNLESEGSAGKAQAFFDPTTNTVFLIADHIEAGTETAVLAHELMHKHGQVILGKEGWDKLHSVLGDWQNAAQGTQERSVYEYAAERVQAAGGGSTLSNQEMFPYAVEAAIKMGIKPNMMARQGTVAKWLAQVIQSLKAVWAKLTNKPETFKAQDLVDLAFAIAQRENHAVSLSDSASTDGKSNVLSKDGTFKGWPQTQNWTRAEYNDVVSLLPENVRNDPHRREPLPTKDRHALYASAIPELEALNKVIGAGALRLDSLGNILVNELKFDATFIDEAIKIADKHDLGIYIERVRTGSIQALQRKGFASEFGLGGVLEREAARLDRGVPNSYHQHAKLASAQSPIARGNNQYAVEGVNHGTVMSYKPRGFSPKIMFSRSLGATLAESVRSGLSAATVTDVKQKFGNRLADFRGMALQALGRLQLVDIYAKDIPMLAEYSGMVHQMDADKNESGAAADALATDWGKLQDERQLAELMHDATLAQIDPSQPFMPGDDDNKYEALRDGYDRLSDKAKAIYAKARDMYSAHHEKVREAIKSRINRSELSSIKRRELLEKMDGEFFKRISGVYFPLSRFGQYLTVVRDSDGAVLNVSRSETLNEAEATRRTLKRDYPAEGGFQVGKVLKQRDFNAVRDGVGRGFMEDLFQTLEKTGASEELQDSISQLYLASLPDLSWAKHGIHRKGTPGFSQDARRAFAQNMFHGGNYLARLRYADKLQASLDDAQEYVDDQKDNEGYDSVKAQQVIDEMVKRHESMMNPQSNPISTALTSFGFVFHLGLSPASAIVNLSQTALVAYPMMGAKWGYAKAAAALAEASKQTAVNKNDISEALNEDELQAYNEAVRSGVIDVTQAHDLAGIAQGEDTKLSAKIRPLMKWASFMFHHAEKFNRQVTFVAAYRLAREAGAVPDTAYVQAVKTTYAAHFSYDASNRPRMMQGNWQKVILLFKQYAQNMIYTLGRNLEQSINAESAQNRAEARKVLAGLLVSHSLAAGAFGLPVVGMLLSLASAIGGDDDEPWDAQVALQNMLADTLGAKPAEVFAHGLSRLTPWDISGRVGLNKLLLPDIQEGLQGASATQAWLTSAAGPVAGILVNAGKGLSEMGNGDYQRGLESMMPSALRGPLKAYRFETQGNIDKTGVALNDEVSGLGVAGQVLGFSPSETRLAQEGKSAIYAADRAIQERRSELTRQFATASMAKDADGMKEARKEIFRFNLKNHKERITQDSLIASVRARQRRIAQAKMGVYLPAKRQDAMAAGRFAQVSE